MTTTLPISAKAVLQTVRADLRFQDGSVRVVGKPHHAAIRVILPFPVAFVPSKPFDAPREIDILKGNGHIAASSDPFSRAIKMYAGGRVDVVQGPHPFEHGLHFDERPGQSGDDGLELRTVPVLGSDQGKVVVRAHVAITSMSSTVQETTALNATAIFSAASTPGLVPISMDST